MLRCLPPFFDGVLHGVLSNTRMPSIFGGFKMVLRWSSLGQLLHHKSGKDDGDLQLIILACF